MPWRRCSTTVVPTLILSILVHTAPKRRAQTLCCLRERSGGRLRIYQYPEGEFIKQCFCHPTRYSKTPLAKISVPFAYRSLLILVVESRNFHDDSVWQFGTCTLDLATWTGHTIFPTYGVFLHTHILRSFSWKYFAKVSIYRPCDTTARRLWSTTLQQFTIPTTRG